MNIKDKLFIKSQHILPHIFLSKIAGEITDSDNKMIKNFLIKKAIKKFNIDISEAQEENIEKYKTFNCFFTRVLKKEVRLLEDNPNAIVSAADGVASQFGDINDEKLIQAKGKCFSLAQFLGNNDLAKNFEGGNFITIYLSPRDYHRVHMPVDGKLLEMKYIPGKLFSVNKITVDNIDGVFAKNERVVCLFETSNGLMTVTFVGALLVGSVYTHWHGIVNPSANVNGFTRDYREHNFNFKKGSELGYFKFGSTVVCTFEKNKIVFKDSIKAGDFLKVNSTIGIKSL